MDKAADSAATTTTRDQSPRQPNKFSHKISKPLSASARPSIESHAPGLDSNQQKNLQQKHLQQPLIYNISKNDFREVVQKLTGSPAHERLTLLPPIQPTIQPTKRQSSRLHHLRPPLLSQLANWPPPLSHAIGPHGLNPNLANQSQISAPVQPAAANFNLGDMSFFNPISCPIAPLSLLPPLPEVHAEVESPVSAYMRYLQSESPLIESKPYQFTGFPPLSP